jgi:tetratricopeptide (TPR) repeat protein
MLLNNLAGESQLTGDFAAAIRLYRQSLNTARAIHDQAGIGRALSNIGSLYAMQGNFTAALQNIEDAMKTAQDTGLKSDQVGFFYAMGDTKLAQGDLAAAELSYQSGASLAAQINDKMNIALGQLSLAGLKLLQDQADEALALARKAADEFHAEGVKDQESQSRNLIASCFLELNKPAEAAKELAAAQQLSPQDPTVKLAVAITASRVALRNGKGTQSKRELDTVAAEARRIGVPGIQFEARLAQGELGLFGGDKRASIAVLASVQQEASRKGYKQFELRAKEITQQLTSSKPG